MRQNVLLCLRGRQAYPGQEPDIIELTTEGVLERCGDGWILQYEESNLTGLEGVTTVFQVMPDKITLSRTGKLNSQMIFEEGVFHDSLYQMEFGALQITVCATKVRANISADGGTVDLVYRIEIEQTTAGTIDYHLEIKPKVG